VRPPKSQRRQLNLALQKIYSMPASARSKIAIFLIGRHQMFSIRLQGAAHVRKYSIRSARDAGWEVSLEEIMP
jgi:hypothetical protein